MAANICALLLGCAVAVAAIAAPEPSLPPRSITLGPLRLSFLTSAVLRFEFGGATEDAPSITFPFRASQSVPVYAVRAHSPTHLIVETSDVLVQFEYAPSLDPATLALVDCAHLNVTVRGTGAVACIGEAPGKVPTDASYPGTVMDEWYRTADVYDMHWHWLVFHLSLTRQSCIGTRLCAHTRARARQD